MLQTERLGHIVRQVPNAACAPFKAFAAWSVRLEAHLRRPEVQQVRVSLPPVPALPTVHFLSTTPALRCESAGQADIKLASADYNR